MIWAKEGQIPQQNNVKHVRDLQLSGCYLSLSQDLEQSEEVEENQEHVDPFNPHGVEDGESMQLSQHHVETVAGEDSQQHDEQEHYPDKGREADCSATVVLKDRAGYIERVILMLF